MIMLWTDAAMNTPE
jgi:hypothetical protein